MTISEMTAALAVHSARAEPIIPDGRRVPNGYILHGPRGNKGCIGVDADGFPDEAALSLWLSGIAYGDAREHARRRDRRESRA